jgi:hypothetical protein
MKARVAALVLLAVLLCGCAGQVSQSEQNADNLKAMRDEVSRVVHDEERLKKIQSTIDRFEFELGAFAQSSAVFEDYLHKYNADPNSPRVLFNDVLGRYEVQRKVRRARVTQIHYELLVLTADEEWRVIARREAELGSGGLAFDMSLTGRRPGDLHKETLAMVDDKDRREKIEAIFESWREKNAVVEKRRHENRSAVFALFQRHDAKPEEFYRLYAESDAIEQQGLGAGLDMRFALKEQLTPEEWRRLFAPNTPEPRPNR